MPLKSVASALVRLSTPLAPLKPVRMAARLTPDEAHARMAGPTGSNELVGDVVADAVAVGVTDAVPLIEPLTDDVALPVRLADTVAVALTVALADRLDVELALELAPGDSDMVGVALRDALVVAVREMGLLDAVCVGVTPADVQVSWKVPLDASGTTMA